MASKAAKKRAKRNRMITLPGAAPVEGRPDGRGRPPSSEDARLTALRARCRLMGMSATPEAILAASEPLMGHDVGRCIAHRHPSPEVRADLWQVWQDMSAARRNWRMRNTGHTGDPQSAAIALIHDDMQTDPGLTVDLRTPAERDAGAKRAEAYWRDQVEAVEAPNWRMALRSAIDGFGKPLWQAGAPTNAGACVVNALEAIHAARKRR